MRKRTPVATISGTIVVDAAIAFLAGFAPDLIPTSWKESWWFVPSVLSLLGIVTLFGIILAIIEDRKEKGEEKSPPIRENLINKRIQLLGKVYDDWIKGVLKKNLLSIDLRLYIPQDTQMPPQSFILQELRNDESSMLSITQIYQIYKGWKDGELLILGESGVGKTTVLLRLTDDLLRDAELNQTKLIPVVFKLSDWPNWPVKDSEHPVIDRRRPGKRLKIEEWLVEELHKTYRIPVPIGNYWVENALILPLFDGLDEMRQRDQEECIKAIKDYQEEQGVPIVICGNLTNDHARDLLLRHTVIVPPLAEQQIDTYLASEGEQVAALREALCNDSALKEIVTTPFMLSIVLDAFRGGQMKDLVNTDSLEELRQRMFEKYVERTLQRRSATLSYKKAEQMKRWLSILACHLPYNRLFTLDSIDTDWLPKNWTRRFYSALAAGLTCVLIVGPLLGVMIGLSTGLTHGGTVGFLFGIATGIAYGILLGGIYGILQYAYLEDPGLAQPFTQADNNSESYSELSLMPIFGFVIAVSVGLIHGLVAGLIVGVPYALISLPYIRSAKNAVSDSIARARWNLWLEMEGYTGIDLGNYMYEKGALILLICLLSIFPFNVAVWLAFGPIYGLLSLPAGLLVYLIFLKIFWKIPKAPDLRVELIYGLALALIAWQAFGLMYGLLVAGVAGLIAVFLAVEDREIPLRSPYIGHFLLRVLLSAIKETPWNYIAFLDSAESCNFLRRVGSGYIFIHLLLRDYFASLKPSQNSQRETM